jgi:hypothetical protein
MVFSKVVYLPREHFISNDVDKCQEKKKRSSYSQELFQNRFM